ncbi:MAG TPA: DNA repair protein RadC, partial [Candidatus Avacidaminococcus intestinavium]|nr:DNA repair protein RadC [Candidatus Avacidaminococcus intestinavium]
MKSLPINDRPREKLIAKGSEVLTESELLAILIGSGTREKSALDISRELLANNGLIKNLAGAHDIKELAKVKGIGKVKAATIIAALELGRRVMNSKPLDKMKITSPEEGVELLMPRLRYASREHFLVVLLNSKNRVIELEQVSEGSLNSSVVHPREVFEPAVLHHAAAILTAHNHPSGDPT